MGKGKLYVVLLIITVFLIWLVAGAPISINPSEGLPHGYDGIVASMHSVEHHYGDGLVREDNGLYYMGIDPYATVYGVEIPMETGIRCSITAPQAKGSLEFDPVEWWEKVMIDGVSYNQSTRREAHRYNFQMTARIETYGNGFDTISDVTFWIAVENNDFSIFTSGDEVAVAIINVYTVDVPVVAQKGVDIDFEPKAGGADFAIYSSDGEKMTSVPDWLQESYVLENFEKFSDIRFPIHVLSATPGNDWGARVDCQVEFTIGLDVEVVGEWKQLRPWRDVVQPEPDKTIWEMLLEFLEDPFAFIGTVIWVIVGFVGTVLVLKFVPDPRFKLVGVAAIWGAVFIFGWGVPAIQEFITGLT